MPSIATSTMRCTNIKQLKTKRSKHVSYRRDYIHGCWIRYKNHNGEGMNKFPRLFKTIKADYRRRKWLNAKLEELTLKGGL